MKKVLRNALTALLLGIGCLAAEGEFRYTLMVNGQSVADSLFVFGRSADASDGIDELDFPAVPNYSGPGGGMVDDFYFRSLPDNEANDNPNNAFSKLYTDMRSSSTNATTWTVCTYNNVTLSWDGKYFDGIKHEVINSGLDKGSSILAIYDSNGNVLVSDMRTTTSCSLAANSVYNIKYVSDENVSSAPETPQEISRKFVVWDGPASDFKLLDVTKYVLVNWTLNFFNGSKKLDDKTIKMADELAYATYNPETGVFSYTHPADFDAKFTEFHLEYTFKYLNFTRAGEDGFATGLLRAVRAINPTMELNKDCKETTIDPKAADVTGKTAAITYNLLIDKDYQKTMTESLVLVGKITLPTWTYKEGVVVDCPWTVSVTSKGKQLEKDVDFSISDSIASGSRKDKDEITTSLVFTTEHPLMTISPDESIGTATDLPSVTVELVCNGNCLSGTVDFTGSFVDVDGNTVTLPGVDDAPGALTARIKVLGTSPNLDIDGSDNGTKYDLTDIRLLRNYFYGGAAESAKGNRTMLSGTEYSGLPDEEKLVKAAEFRAKIADIIDKLDIDGNGAFDLIDIRLVRNYIYGGASDSPTGEQIMLSGTPYKNLTDAEKSEKVADFRSAISKLAE